MNSYHLYHLFSTPIHISKFPIGYKYYGLHGMKINLKGNYFHFPLEMVVLNICEKNFQLFQQREIKLK